MNKRDKEHKYLMRFIFYFSRLFSTIVDCQEKSFVFFLWKKQLSRKAFYVVFKAVDMPQKKWKVY